MPAALDCQSCARAALPDKPLRERVLVTGHWRGAHAFDTSLPGWLVVVPHEPVESLSAALERVTGHLHVVPRMADQPAEERGPRIFRRLGRLEGERLPEQEMDSLAERIAAELHAGRG